MRVIATNDRSNPRLLQLRIRDRETLYGAYMPFIRRGGLFIPTNESYHLGDAVFMLLHLLDELAPLPIAGDVVWITPEGAQGNRRAGIGVQFAEQDNGNIRERIETLLAGKLRREQPTHTL